MCSARRIMNKMLELKKNVMGNWIKDDWQGKTKENVDYSSRVLILAGLAFIILILITHIINYLKLIEVF